MISQKLGHMGISRVLTEHGTKINTSSSDLTAGGTPSLQIDWTIGRFATQVGWGNRCSLSNVPQDVLALCRVSAFNTGSS